MVLSASRTSHVWDRPRVISLLSYSAMKQYVYEFIVISSLSTGILEIVKRTLGNSESRIGISKESSVFSVFI